MCGCCSPHSLQGGFLLLRTRVWTHPGVPNDGVRPYAGNVEALHSELETAGMPLQDASLVTSVL